MQTLINYLFRKKIILYVQQLMCGLQKVSVLGVTVYWINENSLEQKTASIGCRCFRGAHIYIIESPTYYIKYIINTIWMLPK